MPEQQNIIQLKVETNENNQQFTKDNMSISTVEKFVELASKFALIAKKLNPDATFKIVEGSIGLATPFADTISTEIDNVIDGESEDQELVKWMREIQNTFQANGHAYSFNVFHNGNVKNYAPIIKEARQFRAKRKQPLESEFRLNFFRGKLFDAGGRNPNIHIDDTDGNGEIKIYCNEKSAQKATKYLYENIYVSAWEELVGDEIVRRKFCEVYDSFETLSEFKSFHESLSGLQELEILSLIHDKCVSLINNNRKKNDGIWVFDLGYIKKFMKPFIHESVDVNVKNTVLIATASFNTTDDLRSVWNVLHESLKQSLR